MSFRVRTQALMPAAIVVDLWRAHRSFLSDLPVRDEDQEPLTQASILHCAV
jgi:hypothetical protein